MVTDSSAPMARRAGPSWIGTNSVAGNPMRFATGKVPIRRDERWRAGMPKEQAPRHRAYLPPAGRIWVSGSQAVTAWPSVGVVVRTYNRPLSPYRLGSGAGSRLPGSAPRRGRLGRPRRARPDPGRRRPRDRGGQREDALGPPAPTRHRRAGYTTSLRSSATTTTSGYPASCAPRSRRYAPDPAAEFASSG